MPSNVTELSDDELEKVAGGTEIVVAVTAASTIIAATAATVTVTLDKGW